MFVPASLITLFYVFILLSPCAMAQVASTPADLPDAPATAKVEQPSDDPPATMFPHSETSRYYISGQANIIFQAHGPFHSPYEGTNSLLGRGEYKTSLVGTLFLGAELVRNPELHLEAIYDEESAGGRG